MSERTPQIVAIAGIAAGVVLLGGGTLLYRSTSTHGPAPTSSSTAAPVDADPSATPFAPSPTVAGSTPSVEDLSKQYPGLAKLADDPRVASVLKDFAAAYEKGGLDGARAYAVEHGFMNALGDATLTILVDDGADVTALTTELKAAGAVIQGKHDGEINVVIPFAVLQKTIASGKAPEEVIRKLAAIKGVRGVLPQIGHHGNQIPSGSGTSEGVKTTHTDKWQAAGFKGAGVKVGILDPEVSHASKYMGKTIPAGTPVFLGSCVGPGGQSVDDEGIHGLAATEIIHEMAPEAQLFIACSKGDEDASIDWLVKQGVKIISFSASGMYGPRDGTGTLQKRIDQLAASGVLWVNSSGNEGKSFHRGSLAGGPAGYVHQFAPGKTSLGFKAQRKSQIRVTLIWNQWGDLNISDYDLYILDRTGKEVARSQDRNAWLRRPQEQIVASVSGGGDYFVAIRANSAAKAAPFILNIDGAETIEMPVPTGSLGAPADARGAFTVGAVVWRNDVLATYSSQGPTEDGRLKPEISAPTETSSIVYGSAFGGTSSSCPHVSGAAAVVWGRFPNYSRDDVARFLTSHAKDLGPPGPDNMYGAGRLDLGDPASAGTTPAGPVAGTTPTAKPTTTAPATRPTATPTSTSTAVAAPTSTAGKGSDSSGSGAVGVFLAVVLMFILGGIGLFGGFIYLVYRLFKPATPGGTQGARGAGGRGGYGGGPVFPSPTGPAARHAQRPGQPSAGGPGGPGGPGGYPGPYPGSAGPYSPVSYAPAAQAGSASMGALSTPVPRPSPGTVPGGPLPAGFAPGAVVHATLLGVSGPATGASIPLDRPEIVIGREPPAHVVVPAGAVSFEHARILLAQGVYWLIDRHSKNGTFVNGQRIQQKALAHGDVITIGPASYRVSLT